MRIGELASKSGVTPDTIRYYERAGLLPAPRRSANRYRDYRPDALDDLLFIKQAQASGLKLSDIREVMEIAAGGRKPCDHVRVVVTDRLADVEGRLRELRALRTTLEATLVRLDRTSKHRSPCRCAAIQSV